MPFVVRFAISFSGSVHNNYVVRLVWRSFHTNWSEL